MIQKTFQPDRQQMAYCAHFVSGGLYYCVSCEQPNNNKHLLEGAHKGQKVAQKAPFFHTNKIQIRDALALFDELVE
jgi:hypothetical protein